ncbi:capsule assembly Wzi family protein [Terrimonas sp. NA20]|uniref:Capsule assembly Wzi family protein n=1 Tax=Terrimonas ginsenosidimutans TaxID=2908004 RepID=A0ABS9KVV4_9BACT|nr:capsule assembly Wzi family protein [Terrimonas ginsenosidimutans]MCG2616451.1 capsule assembly Wzi family protein [Terrimonas ginsenosidimutans]
MQFIKTLVRLLVFLCPFVAAAQSTYLPQGDKQTVLLERLEIKAQSDSVLNFSKIKPFNRGKYVMNGVKSYLEKNGEEQLSNIDLHNLRSIYMNNTEWLTDEERALYASKKPIWKKLYASPANFFETHVKDFDLVINPVVQYVVSKEIDNDQTLFLNTRGLSLRGRIANKIGFSAYLTDNQERDPLYVQQYISDRLAVPGQGFYKDFKAPGGVDYFDARGTITFNVTKYIDVSFGYDKNFIGNGYRSLYLSDFGNSSLFLRLNTRIWKFNYQNLFMELANADNRGITDKLIGKKYAAMHHLDINLTRWLNVGLFEGVVFGRPNRFEFSYLNPVIFYRSIELQNGSYDNSVAGLDFKANIAKRFQVYGQLLLDEFKLSEIRAGDGWWGNKWGYQLGAKYIDAFGVKNLDLQVETNRVRPFTYSHNDSVANYTHYNQPMAHPLMANFQEYIGIARFQPAPKWMIQAKAIYYTQGRDSSSANYGSNIFLPNQSRPADYGFNIGSGWKTNVFYSSLLVSYELKENLSLELFGTLRKQDAKTAPISSTTSKVISFGVRWNMHRREYDF